MDSLGDASASNAPSMLTICPECGSAVSRGHDTFEVHINCRTVSVPGEYERCRGACGQFYFAPGEMDAVVKRASAIIGL